MSEAAPQPRHWKSRIKENIYCQLTPSPVAEAGRLAVKAQGCGVSGSVEAELRGQELEIHHIAGEPPRIGVGSLLLLTLLDAAPAHRLTAIRITRPAPAALRFYAVAGFHPDKNGLASFVRIFQKAEPDVRLDVPFALGAWQEARLDALGADNELLTEAIDGAGSQALAGQSHPSPAVREALEAARGSGDGRPAWQKLRELAYARKAAQLSEVTGTPEDVRAAVDALVARKWKPC
ncbi:hypothetical protein [Streptomyces zingiberis]|uniref:GNAT family N-acetyltransferase n=1 Tax=Streptomyces zingiberis TaxID=2053010 RepID=A0ABX1BZ80_9ACTN|nr:hypothetical protein [Streptomyces zingiberis]NJQ01723.1 hypothetical protein [Streptomyces zingiberis]